MPRRHLLEIHEQSWCPAAIRDGATDCLRLIAEVGRQYQNVLPLLAEALAATGDRQVIDLCSGGGGPWLSLVGPLNRRLAQPVTVLLTDLFPTRQPIDPPPGVAFVPTPVDATQVSPALAGFRTLFTAFHHFPPPVAQAILQDAVSRGQGIAIFEQTRRHPIALLSMLALPLLAWLLTPFIRPFRPFRWRRLLYTYLLPLIPLVLLFDGVVSCLRTYSTAEVEAMIAALEGPPYRWRVERVPSSLSPIGVMVVIGVPEK